MTPRRSLRSVPPQQLVNPETGEITEQGCAGCRSRDDEINGLNRDLTTWRSRYAKLQRDKEAEAHEHAFWGVFVALFCEWKIATGHMRSQITPDRFYLALPYLDRHGFTLCRFAVWGISAHPNRKQITPGYYETYDAFELVFRAQDTFERYARRGVAIFGRELPVPAWQEFPDWFKCPKYARLDPLPAVDSPP